MMLMKTKGIFRPDLTEDEENKLMLRIAKAIMKEDEKLLKELAKH